MVQFLHEEFFGKVYGYIKGINIFVIRIIAKILFWGALFGIFFLLAWFYYVGKVNWVFWIVGILFAAEVAHFIRKSRERKMSMQVEESSNIQDQLAEADVIKKEKKKVGIKKEVANKEGLLKKKVVKKSGKVLNKEGLLK